MERNMNRSVVVKALLFVISFVVAALCFASSAYAAESGTWGTCDWELDDNGVLTIHEGVGENISNNCFISCDRYPVTKIEINGKVTLPEICDGLFSQFNNCIEIEGLDNLDTSNVIDMHNMFSDCYALASLDLSNFDTSKVTDMHGMFLHCDTLEELDLSSFNTSNVTNMAYMFYNCSSLTNLDLSKWKTSNVAEMSYMFHNCSNLTSIDLSSWNTTNVISMSYMFDGCGMLETIYASNKWNTSNVVNSFDTFTDCYSLTGSNGTAYMNLLENDATYARIDTDETPGYLTYKEYVPAPGEHDYNYPIQVDVMYSTEDGEVYGQDQFTYNYGSDVPVEITTIPFADLQENINNIIPDGYKIKHITYFDPNSGEPRIVTAEDTIDFELWMPSIPLEATIEVAPAVEEPEDNNVTAAFNFSFKATGIQATGFNDYHEAFAALNN